MPAEIRPGTPRGPVVAGIDGRSGGRDALALGAGLAQALGTELSAAFIFASEATPSAVPREQRRAEAAELLAGSLAEADLGISANALTVAAARRRGRP